MSDATTTEPLRIRVDGCPIPQGSKRLGRQGARFVILDDNDKKLRPWRELVRMRAEHELRGLDGYPIDGSVCLTTVFALPRPKRMPTGRTRPTVKPDLSKLVRAVEDSLTDAGVFTDDARVTVLSAMKRYAIVDEEPHVTIYVERLR